MSWLYLSWMNEMCLSHLGKSWLEPWDRNFERYRPKALDTNVQFRWPVSTPAGVQDKTELLLKLDTYLNRVWGDSNPRGHDHPREHSGEIVMATDYRDRDPWE